MPTSPSGRPLPTRARARTLVAFLVLVVPGALLAGCSSDEEPRSGRTPRAGAASASQVSAAIPSEVKTDAKVAHVIGRLPGTRRKAVRQQVEAVIDRWWQRAYLTTGHARIEATRVFAGFTPGAQRRARFDRALMTSADLRAESVTPLMRKVRLDLLAVNGRARSVTARFDLRLRTSGEREGRLRMNGRLFLVHRPAGWRVFGYDVAKGWM